jgi:hypothetical protein
MPKNVEVKEDETTVEAAQRRTRAGAARWDEQTRRFTRTLASNTGHLTKEQRQQVVNYIDKRYDQLMGALHGTPQIELFGDNGTE